jgi:hypothetical protein
MHPKFAVDQLVNTSFFLPWKFVEENMNRISVVSLYHVTSDHLFDRPGLTQVMLRER